MQRKHSLAVAIAAAILAAEVSLVRAQQATPDQKAAAGAKGAHGFDLLHVFPKEGNLFFSPESMAVALGMTAVGARGKTLEAFEKTLHLPKELGWEKYHAQLGSKPPEDSKGFTLRSANRLFARKGLKLLPTFEPAVAKSYGSGFEEIDFTQHKEAQKRINSWVSEQTKDKIPELLKEPHPKPESTLVLVNAVYFKASWAKQFEKSATSDQPFEVAKGKKVTVPLMSQTEFLPYAEDQDAQLVALPYEGRRFEAVFVLPKKKSVSELADALTFEKFEALRASAKPARTQVEVPRFKIDWGKDVSDDLQKVGLAPAFDPRAADFSGMVEGPPGTFVIGAVIHQAVVNLDEAGTEAAAATAVLMAPGGAAPSKPVVFRADRPFLCFIRDGETGAIYFVARVSDPTAVK